MAPLTSLIVVVLVAVLVRKWYLDAVPAPALATTFNETYDYIVVGAGSAGSVVASRLSEDGKVTVLLLEAGDSDWENFNVYTPGLSGLNLKGNIDWEYYTEPQDNGVMSGLKEGRSYWPRGKLLGGSSSINGMQYVRASRHDYDRWADYTRDSGWDYRHVLPYFKQSEDIRIPELNGSEYHGHGGPFIIHRTLTTDVVPKIIEAGGTIGYQHNHDYNGRTMEGISSSQVNSLNRQRWSTSRAFLHPVLNRHNLHVSVRSHVTKIIMKNKRAEGVEVIKDGRKHIVMAKKEIILSAGAIGSPQILMLSGVGPRKHLNTLSIPVVADLPVGQNLQDHLFVDVGIRIREPLTTSWSSLETWRSKLQYRLFGTGPLSSPFSLEVLAFKSTTKESRQQDWPDLEIHFVGIMPNDNLMDFYSYSEETKAELADRNRGDYGFICLPSLLRPESTGTITLKSADPFDYPLINANYLDKREDIELLIRGVQECKKIVDSKPMQEIGAEFTEKGTESACRQHKYDSHEYWECLIKRRPLTIYHPVGTCKMGPRGDPTAVVDSELRVQGISGLRVADASIMPWIVSGNTNAPVIMIGERAADLIRGKTLPTLNL